MWISGDRRIMTNSEIADQILKQQIALFKKGDFADQLAKIEFLKDPNDDRPCWSWSLRNRMIMRNHYGSFDSRNVNEWKKIGRAPRDWKKTVRILAPLMTMIHATDKGLIKKNGRIYKCQTCNTTFENLSLPIKEKQIFSFPHGYKAQAEYDISNTYGNCDGTCKQKECIAMNHCKPKEYTPAKIPALTEFAKKMGYKIKYQVDPTLQSYGSVQMGSKVIMLGTTNPTTFYHELVHKIDELLFSKTKGFRITKTGQDPKREIIAELTGSVLSKIYQEPSAEGFSFSYIENYATKQKLTIDKAINQILPRVEKIIKYIMEESQKLNQVPKVVGSIEVTA
jgi:hypothetical protein